MSSVLILILKKNRLFIVYKLMLNITIIGAGVVGLAEFSGNIFRKAR
jgi:hypothetical protein